MNPLHWIEQNPVLAGVGVVVVGGLFLLLRGGGSSDGGAAAAYYNAAATQAISGNELQAHQIDATASVAQTLITTGGDVENNHTWAATDLAMTQSNNAVAPVLAQYDYQSQLAGDLAGVASIPGTTVTNTKKSNGFLGIGGGTKTTTTYIPNDAATAAAAQLAQLTTNGFTTMH